MERCQPWATGHIRLPPCGLREVCCRVAVMQNRELARHAGAYKRDSLTYRAIQWRLYQPAHWRELLRLFEIRVDDPAPILTGRSRQGNKNQVGQTHSRPLIALQPAS